MSFLWQKEKSAKELLRENQRTLKRSIREIDRERLGMERQEKKLVMDIRKMAKQGQVNAAKVMAKDLVRTRKNVSKFHELRSQLQAVSLRMQTLQSTAAMAEAMRGCSLAMMSMNQRMNLPALQQVIMQFQMQSEKMDMKQEMIGETLDDIFEDDEEEDEVDTVVNQILDEIGVSLGGELANAPNGAVAEGQRNQEGKAVAIAGNGGDDKKPKGPGGVPPAGPSASGGGGEGDLTDDALFARLDALKNL